MQFAQLLQTSVRTLGMILLVMGLMLWNGMAGYALFCLHLFFGGMLAFALFAVLFHAYKSGVSIHLIAFGLLWYCFLPAFGLVHASLCAQSPAWLLTASILHALCGLGAIGLAEIIAAQTRRKTRPVPV